MSRIRHQHGLGRADLIPLLGTASRVSEVFSGKRELSMTMVRNLRERFQVSAILPRRPRKRLAAKPKMRRQRLSVSNVPTAVRYDIFDTAYPLAGTPVIAMIN